MTQKDINNWIMYHEVQRFYRMGFSRAKIARHLQLDSRTVSKYLKMSEEEFEQFLLRASDRTKLLEPYEKFVCSRLKEFPETSASQIHDWLKEHHSDFIEVTPRTVYNFVMYIRGKHNIPYVRQFREYFVVEEHPYGSQAQVDFGQYNLRQQNGKRKKVHFFTMILSRSRMKYVYFINTPFTAETVIYAHEKAFGFFCGIPRTIVYDQDKTIIVDENLGEVILTSTFKNYTKARNFNLHFCRKSDPESKGKVENVIQYIKKNFLYNRLYHDIEILNTETLAWLSRTANYLPHNTTKKSPEAEFIVEKQYLNLYVPLAIPEEKKQYKVRKDNTVNYRSNFYSVPMGTYKGEKTYVFIIENQKKIQINDLDNQFICSHNLCPGSGEKIINTHHKRDTSLTLNLMMEKTISLFSQKADAQYYLHQIKKHYPRYIRDHLQVVLKATKETGQSIIDKTLTFCIKNELFHANDFEESMYILMDNTTFESTLRNKEIIPGLLDTHLNQKIAGQLPDTSNIEEYENIVNINN